MEQYGNFIPCTRKDLEKATLNVIEDAFIAMDKIEADPTEVHAITLIIKDIPVEFQHKYPGCTNTVGYKFTVGGNSNE